uniref:ATP synthase subunit n=1 Tax=Strongyloides papillosus TaxID=174720 RepID=A0A0N5BRY7_STREA
MAPTAAKLSSPRTVLSILRYAHHNSSTAKPNTILFKKINELSSTGKWDNINNAPKLFLWGSSRKEASAVFNNLIGPEAPIIEKTPWRQHLKLLRSIGTFLLVATALGKSYELLVPETYRLKVKYAPKHHDEHH